MKVARGLVTLSQLFQWIGHDMFKFQSVAHTIKRELLGLLYTYTIYHIYHNDDQYIMTFRNASV